MNWGMNGLGILMVLTLISAARAEPSGLLNDTGQTQCLNVTGTALEECTPENSGDDSPFPGQDGRYGRDAAAKYPAQSGFTKPEGSGGHGGFAFTPLDVNGNPIPLVGDPPVPAETPRCVWDRVTNLIWEVKTDDGGLQDKDWTYGWGVNATGVCDADQSPPGCSSNNYVIALNASGVCQFSGADAWRLPTRRELLSIIYRNQYTPLIDVVFFPNTRSYPYWSANANALYQNKAWNVSFETGGSQFMDQAIDPFSVRLVRSGPGGIPNNNHFIENGDGTITDTKTGLMWDQCSWGQIWSTGPACNGSASAYDWSQSLLVPKTANRLLWRGYNDWRLPNPSELESLVKIDSWTPSIDKAVFPNTPSWWFWTSAVNAASFGSAHGVVFDSGAVNSYTNKPTIGNHVRLVRGGAEYNAYDLVQKKDVLPIIIAEDKVYDGTTKATISACTLDMADPNDDVACVVGEAHFDSLEPGYKGNIYPRGVTATGITLSGADARLYRLVLDSATTTATLYPRKAEISVTAQKEYDGSNYINDPSARCTILNPVLSENCVLEPGGFYYDGGDMVKVRAELWDPWLDPYRGTSELTAKAEITILPRTVYPLFSIADKVYDGTLAATITKCELWGAIPGDDIACNATDAHYSDANAGSGKTVTVNGVTISGTKASSYLHPSTTTTTWGNILKAPATVTLGNLSQTYTGSPLSPSATTSPANLAFTWTGAPRTNAGSYPVTATVNEQNYEGTASGTFVIQRAAATVSLGNLTQTYTGLPLSPTATTNPPGLSVSLTGAPQTNAGSYPVTASITDGNYTGSATSTFTIAKAPQAPVFINAPAWVRYQQAGLTVFGFGGSGGGTFTYSPAGSTACTVHPTSGALTITSGSGSCQVMATRLADTNYLEASSAPAIIQVNKALQSPLTVSADPPSFFSGGPGTTLGYAGGSINGSVAYQVSGSPAGLTCKISGSTLTATGGAGTCSVTATMAGNANYEPVTSAVLDVPVVGGVLTGLAAQGQVGTNNQVQFGAFTISGESRKVLIRGLGPALDGFVANAIRDPKIALSQNGAFIPLEVNDDWADAENADEIIALKHQPKNEKESAILRTLEPGIYNVHLSGSGGSTGIGMFQVYAVEGGGNGELKGLAAQGQVGTGNQVQFGAFTITGGPRKVLIRGLGPALDPYILGAIRDPRIALSLNGAPTPLEVNDDWADADNAAEIMALKHQPKNPTESAILRTLEPGIYNVHLSGSGGTEGIGMFQVYTVE